jgi:D-alanyl-D-alanine carboxypeptidase
MKSLRSLLSRFQFSGVIVLTAAMIVGLGIGIQGVFDSASQVPAPAPTPSPVVSGTPSPPPPTTVPVVPPTAPVSSVPTPQLQPPRPVAIAPKSLPTLPSHSYGTDANFELVPLPLSTPPKVATLLGHLPYQENEPQRLVQVGHYYQRPEFLDWEAAEAFNEIKSAARAAGVNLRIISGFRSVEEQEKLFERQIQRRGSQEAAARLSAPPGYSEHHTGYAFDVGDGAHPNTDLKFEFESTKAYHWLAIHAKNYGFELSFPRNNLQGVSFEPWHWRYVGSPRAMRIFATARLITH